ncbi:MAG: methyltransferase domain-containing protein [Pseudomonadota bacterium]
MRALNQIFDQAASGYDALRSRVIPCFAEFYGAIARLVPTGSPEDLAVMDLGAGTGLVSAVVRAACPQSSILAVDASPGMLERLRDRFAGDARVRTQVMDYSAGPLPAGQDVIVSALSIHHLNDAAKQRLFAVVWDCLNPGGVFINADLVRGSSEAVERDYQESWRAHLEASGIPRPELEQIYHRMSYDLTSPLEAQLIWLRAHGFIDVACHYKYNNFAVCAGRRPGPPEVDN